MFFATVVLPLALPPQMPIMKASLMISPVALYQAGRPVHSMRIEKKIWEQAVVTAYVPAV
jgi:hypothetical protein